MRGGTSVARAVLAVGVVFAVALVWTATGVAANPASLTITHPLTDTSTASQTPQFEGRTEDDLDPVSVSIYAGSSVQGSPLPGLSIPALPVAGAWAMTLEAPLEPGVYTAVAEQAGGESTPVTFVIDTTAPTVTLVSPSSPSADSTPTLSGSAGVEAGDVQKVLVQVHKGTLAGEVVREAEVTPSSGSWEYTPSPALPDGAYTAQASQSDEAGNTGVSSAATFIVDTTAPVVTLVSPASPSADSTPTLSGSAGGEAGDVQKVLVRIHKGTLAGEVVREAEVTASAGSWQYTASPALPDGTYAAQASQSDEAGNLGVSSAATFIVDTTAPTVTLLSPLSPSADSTPTLSGSAAGAAGDVQKVLVQIHKGSIAGEVVREAEVTPSGGSWKYHVPSALPDGTYTAQASQSDEAGNLGVSSAATFIVDTTAPTVTLSSPSSPSADSTPTLSGSAGGEAGDVQKVLVRIHKGTIAGEVVREAEVAASSGSWKYTASPALPDGTYTAQASQSDEAGNTGTSAAAAFVIDTTAPTVSVTSPTVGTLLTISRPPISGHSGTAPGDRTTIALSVFAGPTPSGQPVQTLHVTASGGNWSTGANGPTLANGLYTVLAEQQDEAGNVGQATTTFTVDVAAPTVTLAVASLREAGGVTFSGPTPTFSGSAGSEEEDAESVEVRVFTGTSTSGSPFETLQAPRERSHWAVGPIARLADGTYTVQAVQADSHPSGQPGVSESRTFTVDGDAPHVTLSSPVAGSTVQGPTLTLAGTAGTAIGDEAEVTVRLYSGSSTAGALLQTVSVPTSGSGWSASFGGLAAGEYTVRAEQRDVAGNVGASAPVSVTVLGPPPAPSPPPSSGPVAAFSWFPPAPRVGEVVSLVSTSTQSDSPLTAFAWAVDSETAFIPAGPATVTTFDTPGSHIVRLRAIDAAGRASVAAETIKVAPAAATLMQPFPIVRIAGSETGSGARISLLTVQTPVGSTVRVSCRGHGCPPRSQSILARAGRHSARSGVVIEFRRFERAFGAGTVLQIRVSHSGQIGKYTRFTVRRGRLPVRSDTCLSPDAVKPMACPST